MTRGRRVTSVDPTPVEIVVDGRRVTAQRGDTVASALIVNGVASFHVGTDGAPRAPFCNMGTCFECTVTIDGRLHQRSCLVSVSDGLTIETEGE